MNFYSGVLALIEMKSFSSLWYWMILAVSWSLNSHFILGVPFDMVQRAGRRKDADLIPDLETFAYLSIRRLLLISERSGVLFFGVFFFCFNALGILGFIYFVELAQAVFLLLFPHALVWMRSVQVSRKIIATEPMGQDLIEALKRFRLFVQGCGLVAISLTVGFGMVHNMLNVVIW